MSEPKFKNSKRDPEMIEILKNLKDIEWQKEENSMEWNTRARELNSKKAVRAIHKSIFG